MDKTSVVLVLTLFVGFFTNYEANHIKESSNDDKPIVCYFGAWSIYHIPEERFDIKNIEDVVHLCTHVNYGFAKINESTYEIQVFDTQFDIVYEGYHRFILLKKLNPNLKLMISLGGWYEGSEKYSDMVSKPDVRQKFVKSVLKFLSDYKFDGLDLDWEYPANRGGDSKTDPENFLTLLKELHDAFNGKYLLTTALSPGKGTIDAALPGNNIEKLNDLIDWANIMTYDYHGGFDDYLGHNAPMYSRPEETEELEKKLNMNYREFNVNYTIHYYLEKGLHKDKMVMGMPLYGRAWSLMDGEHTHLHDLAKGMSPPGRVSNESGVLGFNEICNLENEHKEDWKITFDYYYKAPYGYNKEIFVGYDNIDSLQCKAAFLKSMGLRGAMIWSLEFDDFRNECGFGHKYPLLTKVYDMINGKEKDVMDCPGGFEPTHPTQPTTVPTTAPTTPPTPAPTTKPTPPEPTTGTSVGTTTSVDFWCSKDGYMAHPSDPHKYFQCEWIPGTGWYLHLESCPGETKWVQEHKRCDG